MLSAAKAFIAGVVAGLSAASGNSGGSTKVDILTDVMAAIIAFNAAYFTPNKKPANSAS